MSKLHAWMLSSATLAFELFEANSSATIGCLRQGGHARFLSLWHIKQRLTVFQTWLLYWSHPYLFILSRLYSSFTKPRKLFLPCSNCEPAIFTQSWALSAFWTLGAALKQGNISFEEFWCGRQFCLYRSRGQGFRSGLCTPHSSWWWQQNSRAMFLTQPTS